MGSLQTHFLRWQRRIRVAAGAIDSCVSRGADAQPTDCYRSYISRPFNAWNQTLAVLLDFHLPLELLVGLLARCSSPHKYPCFSVLVPPMVKT